MMQLLAGAGFGVFESDRLSDAISGGKEGLLALLGGGGGAAGSTGGRTGAVDGGGGGTAVTNDAGRRGRAKPAKLSSRN